MARVYRQSSLGTNVRVSPDGRNSVTTTQVHRTYVFTRDDIRKTPALYKGWRAPSGYQAEITDLWAQGFYQTFDRYKHTGTQTSALDGGSRRPSLPGFDPGLRSRAEVQALSRLKDQKVNLAQFFAERKMTERLFTQTAGDIAGAVKGVFAKDPRAVEKALRLSRRGAKADRAWKRLDPTSRWLEYQYGWLPLLGDLHGAAEALRQKPRQEMRITVKGSARNTWKSKVNGNVNRSYIPVIWSASNRVEAKVSLTYVPSASWHKALTQTGFTNPLQLQWELVPFSFVVDWFVPIGNFLGSLDATTGYEFLGGSLTQFSEVVATPAGAQGPVKDQYSSGVTGRLRHMRFVRTTYNSSPIPTLPRMQAPWAVNAGNRIANAMSLLAQAFGGRR